MYFILEARPSSKVYLGLQDTTNREAFLADVSRAQSEQVPFEITKHVNAWDAQRGDLFIIPAGTVHCSGANNLVLEISATPYIYTFKIYDYLRPDLNGNPRPISYGRAFEVIDFQRKTQWVRENLLAKPKPSEGVGWSDFCSPIQTSFSIPSKEST
jgi:mannose-6-phosphate isomerase class I